MKRRELLTAGAAGLLADSGASAQTPAARRPIPKVVASFSYVVLEVLSGQNSMAHVARMDVRPGLTDSWAAEVQGPWLTSVPTLLEAAVSLRQYIWDIRNNGQIFNPPIPNLTLQDIAVFSGGIPLL